MKGRFKNNLKKKATTKSTTQNQKNLINPSGQNP